MNVTWKLILLLVVIGANLPAATMQELDARQTVVLANRNVPESVELARYYMEKRGIPTNHLCVLDLPEGETIARWYYDYRIREPLQEFLRRENLIEQVRRDQTRVGEHENHWRTVKVSFRYLVSIYGMPLRIAETRPYLLEKVAGLFEDPMQRDGAAVDSELSALLWENLEIKGVAMNPHYNVIAWPRSERQSRPVLIAARLDGPTPDIVRGMIDQAMLAEQNGLHGRVYIDSRSVRDPDYAIGDYWLREAAERFNRLGFEVVLDRAESLFSDVFPMEDAAIYLGWYAEHVAGPFRRPEFRFRPGAIAYHLHSGSAKTLRSDLEHWAGPLLARGAAAVMGAVNEPYLLYTPDLQIFADRIAAGYSFGESAYVSQRVLSWQITIVGDPLYRPFAVGIDERIHQLTESSHPDLVWEYVRRINQLAGLEQLNVAFKFGREALIRLDALPLREKLADLYAKNDIWDEAIKEYRYIIDHAERDITAIRVGQRVVWMLRVMKQTKLADEIEQGILARWPDSHYLPFLKESMP